MKKIPQVSPSLLAAKPGEIQNFINALEGKVSSYHIDVMDNQFVPNYTLDRFAPPFVFSLKTKAEKHIHLMTEIPSKYYNAYAEAGAKLVIFHIEAVKNPDMEVRALRNLGLRAGVSLKPKTPASALDEILPDVDYVLVMTVEPGFGGQEFMHDQLEKIKAIRSKNPKVDIAVDGGINLKTARLCVAAGANILVAGTSIFKSADPLSAVLELIP